MYYLYCFGRFLAVILPRKLIYFLVEIITSIKCFLAKKDTVKVKNNLEPVLSDKSQLNRYSSSVFKNFGFYLADFFSLSKIDKKFIDRHVAIDGQKNLDDALSSNKGAIILSAHIGNYEFGGSMLSHMGYNTYVLALPHKDVKVNKFFNHQREIFGVTVIATGVAVRQCFKHLKDKNLVAFLGDRDFNHGKVEKVEMFGKNALLPKGPYYFSFRTKCAVVPCFFVREDKYNYRFIFEPEIISEETDEEDYTKDMVLKYSKILEKHIAKRPDQWYMFENYWI